MNIDDRPRCGWMGNDELMCRYHDDEWGVPVHEDQHWFEYIVLDAFQAGLSWRTVLHKRAAFRKVFHGFDPIQGRPDVGKGHGKSLPKSGYHSQPP